MIENRSFEDPQQLYGWSEVNGGEGTFTVETESPLNANNPHFLRIRADGSSYEFGVANDAFGGINLREGERYFFSVYARRRAGSENQSLKVYLAGEHGVLARAELKGLESSWKKFEATLTSSGTTTKGEFSLLVTQEGVVDVDMVSLFPEKTFKSRRNGLRADLAQALADAKPGFLRFPGGCIVEGRRLVNRYRWKTTIGDIAERQTIVNRWNDEFDHRPTPD
ncbi:MAG TPA: carbohydrate binding domain-containing protein, partial [Candidatus Tumulicola sp.]|nr:carbohydrate binding domain-containing protein [Candidatus Tumulicola sp.]